MRYTSFRTEVSWLNREGYIENTRRDKDGIDPNDGRWKYGKSYYIAIKSLVDFQTEENKPGRPKND